MRFGHRVVQPLLRGGDEFRRDLGALRRRLLGLFAPTIYLAANLAGDTIAADLTAQSIGEDEILAAE